MTTVAAPTSRARRRGNLRASASSTRNYFAANPSRPLQAALGCVWLLDGALQFQSFMYGRGFIELLKSGAAGEPSWVAASVDWSARVLQSDQVVLNTLFALVQVAIGLGLLYRPTVKAAIAASVIWALGVWWSGEAFGMLLAGDANPLTGAPGAVVLYPLVGVIVWPNGRPGGLLGVRGARVAWAVLWALMGALWLLGPNSGADATSGSIAAAPSGLAWLGSLQHSLASAAAGDGLAIAVVLASVSFIISGAVLYNWHPRLFLLIAAALNAIYWVIGQGFGGILQGGATDPNAGPLFVLLTCALWALVRFPAQPSWGDRRAGARWG